jgi:glycosyltransferase involved in cell wall biosynthesis
MLLRRLSKRTAFVLENPVSPEYFASDRSESTEPLYVVTVGRLCEQKAPDVFAELAVRFAIAESEAKFVWIGGGETRYEQILRDSGVEVTGWLSQAQVRERLQRAAVYVQTSRWEGMPMAVLQALAMGLPCVVTNVVGNRDAVRHGKTGFIARDMDRMALHVAELADNAALRLRMGQAAHADAMKRFSSARFRQSLLQLYGFAEMNEATRAVVPASMAIDSLQTRPATLNG